MAAKGLQVGDRMRRLLFSASVLTYKIPSGDQPREVSMKAYHAAAFAALAGIGVGGLAVHSIHAQTAPRAYVIIDIDVTDQQGFTKEYAPMVGKIIADGGGKYLARGGKTIAIEGTAPKRLTLIEFPSLEKAQATFTSAAYRDARKTGDKFAKKFNIVAEEATAQ
jgi:uncharacterized protein (DUF1330 family)